MKYLAGNVEYGTYLIICVSKKMNRSMELTCKNEIYEEIIRILLNK